MLFRYIVQEHLDTFERTLVFVHLYVLLYLHKIMIFSETLSITILSLPL